MIKWTHDAGPSSASTPWFSAAKRIANPFKGPAFHRVKNQATPTLDTIGTASRFVGGAIRGQLYQVGLGLVHDTPP